MVLEPIDTFDVTAYCDYGETRSGRITKENHTIASDWSVIPKGTKVMIENRPYIYTVEDTGSKVKGNRVDIYMPDYNDCINWGIPEKEVYIVTYKNVKVDFTKD